MSKQITEFADAAREMLAAFGNCGTPRQQQAADKLQECIRTAEQYKATEGEIRAARDTYATDDIEIDDDATTSPGDAGTWVSAWVWVAGHDAEDEPS